MDLATILAGLQLLPGIFAAAEAIKADLSETDLATLEAAMATAKAAALADVATAQTDLAAAAKS